MKQKESVPKASYGYGGKFGVEKDRMDKVAKLLFFPRSDYGDMLMLFPARIFVFSLLFCRHHVQQVEFVHKCISSVQVALGHDYVAQVEQHSSQKDAAKGFGGKFGVLKDRVDKVRRRVFNPENPPLQWRRRQ